MSTFAERLKELRLQHSLTQKDIANILDSKERVILYYEKGERNPPVEKLVILATYFDCSIDYLVGRTDNPRLCS